MVKWMLYGCIILMSVGAFSVDAGCVYSRMQSEQVRFFQEVKHGRIDSVRVAIRSSPDLLYARDDFGYTPLLLAVSCGHTRLVVELIRRGSNCNERSRYGDTALLWAAEAGEEGEEILQVLIKAKADVNACNNVGFTPLMMAAIHNRYKTVEALIKAGANPHVMNKFGKAPYDLTLSPEIKALLEAPYYAV